VARGVFAVAQAWKPREWHHVLEAARDRFADHNRLRAAVERQAVIERAKGILMERHSLDDRAAFELIRRHARSGNRKVVDVASAVVAGHMLLPASGQ
jgi:response regulator NasT